MSKFPVTYSLVSPKALEKRVITLYNLPAKTQVIFLHQGINDSYLVDTLTDKFILRIYRTDWRTVDEIEGELELLSMLHKSGIAVSYPITDKKGKFIQQLDCPEGVRCAVIFTYALGQSTSSLNLQSAQLFGQYMAALHQKTEGLKIGRISREYTVAGILDNTSGVFQLMAHWDKAYNRTENVYHQLKEKLNRDSLTEVRSGICHGDPHFENFFVDHSSGTITMFDFDFCGHGYLLYDLGSFCRYERNSKDNRDAFFKGYEQLIPLNETEKKLLPYFEVLMRVFHLGARLKNADGIRNAIWSKDDVIVTINNIDEQLSTIQAA